MKLIVKLASGIAIASSMAGLGTLIPAQAGIQADSTALDIATQFGETQLVNKCDRINDPSSCAGA